jgi:hypothetical protein
MEPNSEVFAAQPNAEATPPAARTYPPGGEESLDVRLDRFLAERLESDVLSLHEIGKLLGDDPQTSVIGGPRAYRLIDEARSGRMPIADGDFDFIDRRDDAGEIFRRTERIFKDSCMCRRADFRTWLYEHGSELNRQSRAATWAEHQPAGAAAAVSDPAPSVLRLSDDEDDAALA